MFRRLRMKQRKNRRSGGLSDGEGRHTRERAKADSQGHTGLSHHRAAGPRGQLWCLGRRGRVNPTLEGGHSGTRSPAAFLTGHQAR